MRGRDDVEETSNRKVWGFKKYCLLTHMKQISFNSYIYRKRPPTAKLEPLSGFETDSPIVADDPDFFGSCQ